MVMMMMDEWIERCKALGADAAAAIDMEDIVFDVRLRESCEQNLCRQYAGSWSCPPAIGAVEDCIEKL